VSEIDVSRIWFFINCISVLCAIILSIKHKEHTEQGTKTTTTTTTTTTNNNNNNNNVSSMFSFYSIRLLLEMQACIRAFRTAMPYTYLPFSHLGQWARLR